MYAYLASPFTHADPEIVERRVRGVTDAAIRLHTSDVLCYAPIMHNAPLIAAGVQHRHGEWMAFDTEFLAHAGALVVLTLPGWKDSKGVSAERAYAIEHSMPVFHWDGVAGLPPDLLALFARDGSPGARD